jgi:hypothetical protein
MPVLLIGKTERENIAKVIAYAKAHPLSIEALRKSMVADAATVRLKDRQPGHERQPGQHIMFPGGYHAAFSIEQQPPGFCSHLSVSVEGRAKKGMMPSEPAVQMICEEFGVPYPADKIWVEEYQPGEFAVNLVSLYAPLQEGHA